MVGILVIYGNLTILATFSKIDCAYAGTFTSVLTIKFSLLMARD